MDSLLNQRESLSSRSATAQRVLADARRAFDEADSAVLERCASQVVAELWSESIRVKTFLPVLAMRRIRETLDLQNRVPGGERSSLR